MAVFPDETAHSWAVPLTGSGWGAVTDLSAVDSDNYGSYDQLSCVAGGTCYVVSRFDATAQIYTGCR